MKRNLLTAMSIVLLSSQAVFAAESVSMKISISSESDYLLKNNQYIGQMDTQSTSLDLSIVDSNNVVSTLKVPNETAKTINYDILTLDGNILTVTNTLHKTTQKAEVVLDENIMTISREENLKILEQGLKAKGEKLIQQLSLKVDNASADFKVDVSATHCLLSEAATKMNCKTSATVEFSILSK